VFDNFATLRSTRPTLLPFGENISPFLQIYPNSKDAFKASFPVNISSMLLFKSDMKEIKEKFLFKVSRRGGI